MEWPLVLVAALAGLGFGIEPGIAQNATPAPTPKPAVAVSVPQKPVGASRFVVVLDAGAWG